MNPFNGTIETTFFGFLHTNIQIIITKAQIGKRIVGIQNDILFYNVSNCANPDRNTGVILVSTLLSLICLASFCLQISLFPTFWRLTKLRGPAFTIMLNMLFCSSFSVLFSAFIFYFELSIGFRLQFPLQFLTVVSYWNLLKSIICFLQLPKDGESTFYFLFSVNRCAALLFPFNYSSIFNRRNVFWMICMAWIYTLLFRGKFFLANKGFNKMHCLGPGPNGIDDWFESYGIIMDPSMLELESLARKGYYLIWYSPMLMDICTLIKLFFDKYEMQSAMPWIVKRLAGSGLVEEGRNERIRLFLICLAINTYHFFWAYLIDVYAWISLPKVYYYYSYIVENAMPYLLMLWISNDVRRHWKRTIRCCYGDNRIEPRGNSIMYPTTEL